MTDNPRAALYAAMAKAFPEIEGATKTSENPAFKRDGKALKYADLASVSEAIKPALSAHGLFYVQVTHERPNGVCVETILGHSGGEQMSLGLLFMPVSKNDAHGYGSALSYARRYGLMAAFGVCPEEDDGNAATAAAPKMITPAQVTELQALAKEVGAPEKAFLSWANVPSWADIPAVNYMDARNKLESKRKPDDLSAGEY